MFLRVFRRRTHQWISSYNNAGSIIVGLVAMATNPLDAQTVADGLGCLANKPSPVMCSVSTKQRTRILLEFGWWMFFLHKYLSHCAVIQDAFK